MLYMSTIWFPQEFYGICPIIILSFIDEKTSLDLPKSHGEYGAELAEEANCPNHYPTTEPYLKIALCKGQTWGRRLAEGNVLPHDPPKNKGIQPPVVAGSELTHRTDESEMLYKPWNPLEASKKANQSSSCTHIS